MNTVKDRLVRQAKRFFPVFFSALLAMQPLAPVRQPASPQAASPASEAGLAETYSTFEPESQTWAIGNAMLEERFWFTFDGSLQGLSLTDKTDGQIWNVSGPLSSVSVSGTDGSGGGPTDLTSGLTLAGTTAERSQDGALTLGIRMDHFPSGQQVTVETRIQSGLPVLERRVLLANLSAQSVRAIKMDSLSMGLSAPGTPEWEATNFTTDGKVQTARLSPEDGVATKMPLATSVPEAFIPYLIVRNRVDSQGFLAGIRWSADWRLSAKTDIDSSLQINAGLHLSEPTEDSIILPAGERIQGPWILIGHFAGDTDDAANLIDRYTEDTSADRPQWAATPPVTWNSWYAYLKEVDEQRLVAEADLAAQLGVDVFYVDYGWSLALGDWRPDPKRFSQGLVALADHVHSLGMAFGLWVAFGTAAPESELVRDHSEFLAIQPDPPTFGIDGAEVLCLTASKGWLDAELDRIVREYRVDWLKFDQPMISECLATDHPHEPTSSSSLFANTSAFYQILDKLGTAHPNLVIENCYDGDGYLDFGTKQYTDVTWLTDNSGHSWVTMPLVQSAFNGVSYAFRPEYLVQWLAANPDITAVSPGRTTSPRDLSYQAFSTMGGSWGLSMRLTEMTGDQLTLLGQLIAEYKGVRGLIATGQFYHLVSPSNVYNPWDGGWMVLEYYHAASGQGAILYVRNGEDTAPELNVQLRGLEADCSYLVWAGDNQAQSRSGQELMENGLSLSAEPRQGGWLRFERVN